MFEITHGKNKGAKVRSEDEALALLTPEDLAQGGYVHYGSTAFLDGGEYNERPYPPCNMWDATRPNGSTIVGLMKNIHASWK